MGAKILSLHGIVIIPVKSWWLCYSDVTRGRGYCESSYLVGEKNIHNIRDNSQVFFS